MTRVFKGFVRMIGGLLIALLVVVWLRAQQNLTGNATICDELRAGNFLPARILTFSRCVGEKSANTGISVSSRKG